MAGELPEILIVNQSPSPQRVPVFDKLSELGLDFLVAYLRPASWRANWGPLEIAHPHEVIGLRRRDAAAWFLRVLAARRLRVVAVFGLKGPVTQAIIAAARLTGKQVITRSDANFTALQDEPRPRQLLRRLKYRALLPRNTRIWAIGESNRRYWRDYIGLDNITVIPYSMPALPQSLGVASVLPRKSDPERMRFLFVGRLVGVKDIPVLVEAFAGLTGPECSQWRLTIVGEGPEQSTVERMAALDDRVVLAGACDYERLDVYYTDADVLVLPSRKESWGLVVNEALAFGLRVLVSDRVGAGELVREPRLGEVFPAGDMGALRAALRNCVHHLDRVVVPPTDPTMLMHDELVALRDRCEPARRAV